MITLIICLILKLTTLGNAGQVDVVVIPPVPAHAPNAHTYSGDTGNEDLEWHIWYAESYWDARSEFTALFNSYECKRAKNGAMMIRRSGEKSFKFAKKG